jgi:hypothetical protein
MAFLPRLDGSPVSVDNAGGASLVAVPVRAAVSQEDGVERVHILAEKDRVSVRRLANRHGCSGVPRPPPARPRAERGRPRRYQWLASPEHFRLLTLLTLKPALPVALTFSARLPLVFHFLHRFLDLAQALRPGCPEDLRAQADVKAGP